MLFLPQDYGNVDKVFYMDHFYGIYGIGAIIIIISSQYFNRNNITLFLGGYAIGSITEYLISFLVEVFLHAKWWDYSNNILNINGRVCLLYSVFWGILTVFLVRSFQPLVDGRIEKITTKISHKIAKTMLAVIILFLLIDCMATCCAQDAFITRIAIENNIEMKDIKRREEEYQKIQEKQSLARFINAYWNDEKMIRTFPNMKIEDRNNNIIYLDSLLPEIQPYYKKIFEK